MIRERLGSARTTSSSSSRRTTATCSSTSSGRASRSSGIDPAANVAKAAEERGVPTLVAFFGDALARQLVAEGRARATRPRATTCSPRFPTSTTSSPASQMLLRADGTATFEFPHLLRLLDGLQYDTIYHEHFSYFSLATISRDLRGPRPRAVRRRGALDARRLAPRLRAARRRAARGRAGRRRALAREERERSALALGATRASPRT